MTSASTPKNAFLHPFAKPTKDSFIKLVRGQGALVWDDKGNELIDGMASLWYCAVGHGRKEIGDAVAKQISTLEAYSTLFCPPVFLIYPLNLLFPLVLSHHMNQNSIYY